MRYLILAAMLALAACAGSTPSATVTIPAAVAASTVLTPAQLAIVQQLCAAAAPGLLTATSPLVPASVSNTAVYPAAFCADLAALPAGMVPATTTSATPQWLTTTLTVVEDAAKVAGLILPLLP